MFIRWRENGGSVEGWWSNMDQYSISDGSNSFGRGLCSLGYYNSPIRAIGAIPYEKAKIITFGVSFTSDYDILEIDIEYVAEQWRYGGTNDSLSSISCEIGIFDRGWYDHQAWGALLQRGWPWQEIEELQIHSVVDTGNGPIPLDGTDSAYSYKVKKSISITWPQNTVLQIRWIASKTTGVFNSLGLSNFTLRVTPKPISDIHSIDWYKIYFYVTIAFIAIMIIICLGVYCRSKKYPVYSSILPPEQTRLNTMNDNPPTEGGLSVYELYITV
jgi:hypothetical protein